MVNSVPLGGVAQPLTLTKRIFPASLSLLVLLSETVPAVCATWQEKRFCIRTPGRVGAARTMKLFRMAFWLGVVIYNLPSPGSQPATPESQINGSQGFATKAASQLCPQSREPCAKIAEGRHDSSRDARKPSQDTLAPADRAVPLRGPALRKGLVAKRSEGEPRPLD